MVGQVTLRLFNRLGQLLVEQKVSPDEDILELDVNGLADGLYIIDIAGRNFRSSEKLVVIR
jgi:hypothetical protein